VEGGLGFEHKQKEILAVDGGESLARYRAWSEARLQTIERGARPEFEVFLASQAADAAPGEEIPLQMDVLERAATRPRGRRFGTLVHMTLRDAPLDATPDTLADLAALNARIVGAPPEERDAAQAAAAAALEHPLLARARAAKRLHREYPIVFQLDDGRLLDGVIDLAFVENGEWIVVDFKTEDTLEPYANQVRWYAYALARLTGMTARACLLGV
jgi:ATP-dependent exoDNAse (exonuclease V) beta subunit